MPDVGETVTLPTRLEDSAMDQLTDPDEAVKVSVLPFRPTTIVVGDTRRKPRLGAELLLGAGAELDVAGVDGAGELGRALALDGGAEVGGLLLPGEPGFVDDPPVGCPPPAAGAGDTRGAPFADTVGCGRLLDPPLGDDPAEGGPAAAMLVPEPETGPRAAEPLPW
ncbi:MAG: hypothetical protein ACRDOB_17755 [Streptosporangiaceae bacterium]